MNFRYKCILQSFFSCIPDGEYYNYLCQKYVTKNLPASNKQLEQKITIAKKHFQNYNNYGKIPSNMSTYYEFGAGWDLIIPITMKLLGFNTLYCIDIRENAVPELIRYTIQRLGKYFPNTINFSEKDDYKKFLYDFYNIKYLAPCDARQTPFEGNSIDFICSTVTFEHIPVEDITEITKECCRILKPGGIVSCKIDYQDHWSYFDKKITVYNFLKYDEKKWKCYNPDLHYQNRLRHKDYINIFTKYGFDIIKTETNNPTKEDFINLNNMAISSAFNNYSLDELGIKGAWIIMRKS